MQTATRRRTTWAIAVSAITHLLVGTIVVLQKPELLRPPIETGGPPEAIIPLLIMPKTPPAANGKPSPPAPIRLHRRPQPFLPPDVPPAPIAPPAPPAPPTPAPQAHGPVVLHPSPMPEGPKGEVRTVLRQGPVGCANANAVGLNRAERDHCNEVFGKGSKDTAFAGLGLSPDKQRLLDAAGARKEADYQYKHDLNVSPLNPRSNPGATAEGMKDSMGVPGHSSTIPF